MRPMDMFPPCAQTRVIYQWLRLERFELWWHWLALFAICLAVLAMVVAWYRRDAVEQARPVGWALIVLRIGALAGLLLFFLQLEKRFEERVVRDSRVAILVDTSISMSLPADAPTDASTATTRADEALRLMASSDVLRRLAESHQVDVYRFDALPQPTLIASLPKRAAGRQGSEHPNRTDSDRDDGQAGELARGRTWAWLGLALGAVAAVLIAIALGCQLVGIRQWSGGPWFLFVGTLTALTGLTCFGLGVVPYSQYSVAALLGNASAAAPGEPIDGQPPSEPSDASPRLPEDWRRELDPRGRETRLGDAIKSILDRELGNPLAGIVIVTDGRSNAGVAPRATLLAAQSARVPIFAIGVGSPVSPPNVQLVELDLPKRLYPGDKFEVTALLGGSGYAGKSVAVQILAGPAGTAIEAMSIEDERSVPLDDDGRVTPVSWTLEPKAVGKWQYAARVIPPPGDFDPKDNVRVADVEVIERRNRVLILAGGPTREYQFARNLLYRDRDVESHVLLQTAGPLTSQEAQQLLDEFPADRQTLSQYDAVLAFDADWTKIPESSVLALEQWVAEQAGGFLLVAGSVEMPKWLARSADGLRSQLLRSLAPVVLEKRGSALLASGRIEAETPWPLALTADGRQSEILWLTDDPQTSFQVWEDFEGVYGYYSAYELKPGAKALLHFSDPRSAIDGQLPIYFATQFYGAGRTAYLGGGELWRIRALGDHYFDRFYTKLVRWLSQGRLLLDSDRGALLVDRESAVLGEQVSLRAVLKNRQYEPLIQSEVVARLVDPAGLNTPLVLRPLPDGAQPGVYTGTFTIQRPGDYTIQLTLGGLASDEVLRATVRAKVPTLEMQHAERHDELLSRLAAESGGRYWRGVSEALADSDEQPPQIVAAIPPKDQVAFLPGTPDQVFQLRWRSWLLALIAGCLSLEWFTRRLHRLA